MGPTVGVGGGGGGAVVVGGGGGAMVVVGGGQLFAVGWIVYAQFVVDVPEMVVVRKGTAVPPQLQSEMRGLSQRCSALV